jgi:hypothetical protein
MDARAGMGIERILRWAGPGVFSRAPSVSDDAAIGTTSALVRELKSWHFCCIYSESRRVVDMDRVETAGLAAVSVGISESIVLLVLVLAVLLVLFGVWKAAQFIWALFG